LQGPIWTLETAASICERLTQVTGARPSRRLSFLFYEFKSLASGTVEVRHISEFIFDRLGFKTVESKLADLNDLLLPEVIQNRAGIPLTLGLLFRGLAEKVGISTCFIRSPDLTLLKCRQDGESKFVDLSQNGKILDNAEMLSLLQKKQQGLNSSGSISFEAMEEETILGLYFNRLCQEFLLRNQDQKLITLYEAILRLQPKNFSVLRDRSMAYLRLNRFQEALLDLKRYLSFSEPSQQPQELINLVKKLEDQENH
jgi:regulator of sirC expression with transglutaminase-like and TPR domain